MKESFLQRLAPTRGSEIRRFRQCIKIVLTALVFAQFGESHGQGSWQTLSSVNAPLARIISPNTAIWTGTEMLVWGSSTGADQATILGDGGAYDPSRNSWRALPAAGAP